MFGGPVVQISDNTDDLARQLDTTGFVCLENVVTQNWLTQARDDVRGRLAKFGETDFCIINSGHEPNSPASEFVADRTVNALMHELAHSRCPWGVSPGEEIYTVLRVLAGPERAASSNAFHYDAAVVTMLVPLFIPDAGQGESGELVVLPNRRPFRRSSVVNLAEKVLTQNSFYRDRITKQVNAAPDKYFVTMKPGNVYLFWGYRTFHGNLHCAPDTVRATLLLHLGNPHANSALLGTVRKFRRLIAPSSEHTEATVVRL